MTDWFNIDFSPRGWVCPVCNHVMSPSQPFCIFCGDKTVIITDKTVEDKKSTPIRDMMMGKKVDTDATD